MYVALQNVTFYNLIAKIITQKMLMQQKWWVNLITCRNNNIFEIL